MEIEGYPYVVQCRKRDGVQYLRCKFKNEKFCKGTAKYCPMTGQGTPLFVHNHPPEEDIKGKFRAVLVKRAKEEMISLRDIYDDESRRNPDASLQYPFLTAEGAMRMSRRKSLPAIPRNLLELGEVLTGTLAQKFECHGEAMCKHIVRVGESTSIIFFCRNLLDSAVGGVTEIHVDGTFKVVPSAPQAKQLMTVHAILQNTSIPLAYALMERRTEEDYRECFLKLKEATPTLDPEIIITDFETGLQNALHSVWVSAEIKGCFFHFAQAVWKKNRALGYLRVTNSDINAKTCLKMLMALPLLPANRIEDGIGAISGYAQQHGVGLSRLITYIRRYWIVVVGVERISVYDIPRRTNNNVEGFHNRLKQRIGELHPNIWFFMAQLRKCQLDDHIKLNSALAGERTNRSRNNIISNNVRIRDAKVRFEAGQVTLLEYLKRVAYAISSSEESLSNWATAIREPVEESEDEDEGDRSGVDEQELDIVIPAEPFGFGGIADAGSENFREEEVFDDDDTIVRNVRIPEEDSVAVPEEDNVSNAVYEDEAEVVIDELQQDLSIEEVALQAVERAIRRNPGLPASSNSESDSQGEEEFDPEDFTIPEDENDADWQLQFETFPEDYNLHLEEDNVWEPVGEDEDTNDTSDEACPICFGRKMRFVLTCGHRLCGYCCKRSFNPTRLDASRCPVCRQGLANPPLRYF